jgi:hypothetical protein
LPGLGKHRSEGDDIVRRHVLADRAVGTTAFDDPLHGAVDLRAHRQGFRGCDRRPAVQRQDEFVPLGDRGFDEEFFTLVGQPVATRTEAPPPLDADAQVAFIAKSKALAPEYQTELLPPPGAE